MVLIDLEQHRAGERQAVFVPGERLELERAGYADRAVHTPPFDPGEGDAEVSPHGCRNVDAVRRCVGLT